MKYTKNLGLKLPEATDPVKVSDLNENFEELDKAAGAYEVGDLRSTLRTDLGDRWLLCNGEAFDPAEYPELAEILPGGLASMGAKAKSRAIGSRPDANWELGAYATDGVTQLAAYERKSVDPSAATTNNIYWSSNNFKSVTAKTTQRSFHRIRLFFANGHWIAFTGSFASQTDVPPLTYCYASAEPFVNFAGGVSMGSGNTNIYDVLHVEYANGVYYAFCVTYPSGGTSLSFGVLASTSPDFQGGTFTTALGSVAEYSASGTPSRFQLCRADDRFVFFFWPGASRKLSKIAWASTPAGPYQQRTLSATDQIAVTGVSPPRFVDGKYVWVGSASKPGEGSTKYTTLAYLGDLESGAVTYVYLAFTRTANLDACGLVDCGDGAYAFFLDDEKYIYVGNVDIFQASSWTRGALNTAPVISDGGVAYERDGTVDISIASGILSIPKAAVPTVSIANCYTYVKAK